MFGQMLKVVYGFAKFKPVKFHEINTISKIKKNEFIQHLKNDAEFKQFYSQQQVTMNIINHISYIRRYTDLKIQEGTFIDHLPFTFEVLDRIRQLIVSQEYLKFNDKHEDYRRSFNMLLSLTVELSVQTKNSKEINALLEYAKLAITELRKHEYHKNFNLQELSVFLRCITQIKQLRPTIEEEEEYWVLISQITKMSSNYAHKLLHSIAKFKSVNISEIIRLIDLSTNDDKSIQIKDCCGQFETIKIFHSKSTQLHESLQKSYSFIQKWMLTYQHILDIKQIAVLYQSMSVVTYPIEEGFLKYLELQLSLQKKLSLLALAHIFHFYNTRNLIMQSQPELINKMNQFLKNLTLRSIQDVEQFAMFFNDYSSHQDNEFIELALKLLKSHELNDFSLSKIFNGIARSVANHNQLLEITGFALKQLESNAERPINLHALNSILRSRLILNGLVRKQIEAVVNKQIETQTRAITIEVYKKHLEAEDYFQAANFLQVLVDFLKVQSENFIPDLLKEAINEIINLELDPVFQKKAKNYIQVLEKYVK